MTTQASAFKPRSCATTSAWLTFSGLSSGTLGRCWAAHAAMGVGVRVPPRPAGRSGWETTARIACRSCPDPWAKARSVGRPNAPEPKKTSFMRGTAYAASAFAGQGEKTGLEPMAPGVLLKPPDRQAVLEPGDLAHAVDNQ